MERRPSWRISLITLGASLALHAALLAWLMARPEPPAPPPPRSLPLELEIVDARPPPPAPPPAGRPRPVPPSKPAPTRRSTAVAPPPPPAAVAASPPTGGTSDKAPPGLDAPVAGPGDLPAGARPDDLALLGHMPVVSAPSPGLRAPPAPKDGKELISGIVSQTIGIHRVRGGNVPTYFSELRKVLLAAWDMARLEKRRRQQGRSLHTTHTTILLTQDRAGAILRVELLAASGDQEVDLGALSDLQRAAKSLPAPPPDAIGDRERLTSIWDFGYQPSSERPPRAEFDLVTLFDKRAIPPYDPKELTLLSIP